MSWNWRGLERPDVGLRDGRNVEMLPERSHAPAACPIPRGSGWRLLWGSCRD